MDINKPIALVVDEFTRNMMQLIQDSQLPCFILEPILKDFYNQLSDLRKQELQAARKEYETAIAQKVESIANAEGQTTEE
jgi:hypothetical protein